MSFFSATFVHFVGNSLEVKYGLITYLKVFSVTKVWLVQGNDPAINPGIVGSKHSFSNIICQNYIKNGTK